MVLGSVESEIITLESIETNPDFVKFWMFIIIYEDLVKRSFRIINEVTYLYTGDEASLCNEELQFLFEEWAFSRIDTGSLRDCIWAIEIAFVVYVIDED